MPGSSDVFEGGVIAYANAVKTRELGVAEALLASEGAVSEAVAKTWPSPRERIRSNPGPWLLGGLVFGLLLGARHRQT